MRYKIVENLTEQTLNDYAEQGWVVAFVITRSSQYATDKVQFILVKPTPVERETVSSK